MQRDINTNEIKKQIEDNQFRRYVLSVTAGQESLVIENLQERVNKQGLNEDVVDFLSPMVSEASMKKGEKVVRQKKLYPGYVFFKSKMNDKKYSRSKTYRWGRDKAYSLDRCGVSANDEPNCSGTGKS